MTRALGDNAKVLLDDGVCKFMVTSARSLMDANSDVMDFADVTGCRIDVDESRTELKQKDKDGKDVSCVPARYRSTYTFNEIRFRLNGKTVEINNVIVNAYNRSNIDQRKSIDYCEYEKLGQEIADTLTHIRTTVRENIAAANAPKASVKCPFCGSVIEA